MLDSVAQEISPFPMILHANFYSQLCFHFYNGYVNQ